MRITLTIPSLGAGGAERIVSVMANYWAQKGWDVNILTLDDGSELPFFPLHTAVKHRPLNVMSDSRTLLAAIRYNARRILVLRQAIKASKPDVIISFLDRNNVLTLLTTIAFPIPVIVDEQNDPYRHDIGKIWNMLRHYTYLRAAAVVLPSDRSTSYFSSSVQWLCRTIPNPVLMPVGDEPAAQTKPLSDHRKTHKMILAMGRLVEQKGFDMLLDAFGKVATKHPTWHVDIWGEGPLRARLEAQRDQIGLQTRVRLPGRTSSPLQPMQGADVFVLSSRHEGFPTVIGEAMACGLPVVSYDCRTGPREMIRDGVDGLLVPDGNVAALAETLDRVMSDATLRERLSQRAPEVLERFGLEHVMKQWEACIYDVIRT